MPTGIGVPGVFVAKFIGVTVLFVVLVTYAIAPSGVMAIFLGEFPKGIAVSGVFVAKFIGVTVLSEVLVTYAIAPSGVMAIPLGSFPTGIGVPGIFVAKVMGMTAELLSHTYAMDPSGVMAIPLEDVPTGIGAPGVFVATSMGVTVPSVWLLTYTNGAPIRTWVHKREENRLVSHQRGVHLFRGRIGIGIINCSY